MHHISKCMSYCSCGSCTPSLRPHNQTDSTAKTNTQQCFESVRSASWIAGRPPQTDTNIWLIKTVCNQVKCKTEFAKATDEQVALMALRWSPLFFVFVSAPGWAAAFVACGLRPGWYMTANCCLMHSIGHIGGAVTLTVGWNGGKVAQLCRPHYTRHR